ncbi:MAG: insulinase family protein [Clostridiales bacterium]|nr:insulinase family protein [Clostridiales bacterium]
MTSNQNEYKNLANGVKFLCVNSDKFNTNAIWLNLFLPVAEDLPACRVLTGIMGQASNEYPSPRMFNSKLEWLYGASLDTSTVIDGDIVKISFELSVLDDKFALDNESISEQAEDFLFDIILNPHAENKAFDSKDTEREKRFSVEDIDAIKNDKILYAKTRLKELMFEGEIFGTKTDWVREKTVALNETVLYEAYIEMLQKSTIVITACGSLNAEILEEKARNFISSIVGRNPLPIENKFITDIGEVRYFRESMDMNQAKLDLGFRTKMADPDDNYYAYRVMADMFGGGPYSRLFTNVREKMSLCYYCSSRFVRKKGAMIVQSGIEKENYECALEEILRQMDIIRNNQFEDSELEASKKSIVDSLNKVEDHPVSVCSFYLTHAFDKEFHSLSKMALEISMISREQVAECARNTLLDTVYFLEGEEVE